MGSFRKGRTGKTTTHDHEVIITEVKRKTILSTLTRGKVQIAGKPKGENGQKDDQTVRKT